MYRLLEITYTNDRENVAIYPTEGQTPFADITALTAEFDTKMGAAMKADAYKAECLVAFDNTGRIYEQGCIIKEDGITLSPRLVWVTADANGETANQKACADATEVKADMYTKRGAAKKNESVLAILNLGIVDGGIMLDDYWSRPIQPTV